MKEKISSLQLGSLVWSLMLSSYMGIVPYILFTQLKQDSWLALILDFTIGIVVLAIYLYIWNKEPKKTIFEKIKFVFGKTIGTVINFLLTLTALYMTTTYFYNMISFISSQYLIKTPTLFIIGIFVIPVIYLINQKLNVIGRVTFTFWIISAILFGLTFFGLSSQLELSNLYPVIENGIFPILKGSLICMPYTHFVLLLLLSIPKDSVIDKEKLNNRVILFYTLTFFAILVGILFITTTLGGELAKMYQFVEFQVLKRVSVIGFIERIESTLSIRWILYMFVTATIGLYFIKTYIRNTFPKAQNKEKIIMIIISITLLVLSDWIFPNYTLAHNIIIKIIPYFLYVFYFLLPLIIAIGLKLKKQNTKK